LVLNAPERTSNQKCETTVGAGRGIALKPSAGWVGSSAAGGPVWAHEAINQFLQRGSRDKPLRLRERGFAAKAP
jgi:hypothetical protein